jgi:hypothetical protein
MKHRILAALTAVIFMLFSLAPAAYAVPSEDSPPEETADVTLTPDANEPEDAEAPSGEPFTPSGMGSVIDYAGNGAEKVFYTVMTDDGHVFYLVIDHEKGAENVYFLNAVTVDDLMALAEPSKDGGQKGSVSAVPDVPAVTPAPEATPAPEPAPQGGGNMGTPLLVIAVVILGGGAGWYFKIYRPKQAKAGTTETEGVEDEAEPEDWDDTEDGGEALTCDESGDGE